MDNRKRLRHLRNIMKQDKIDAAIISSYENMVYFSSLDCFSKTEREGYILIDPFNNFIITDGRYYNALVDLDKDINVIKTNNGNSYIDEIEEILMKSNYANIGIEEYDIKVDEYMSLKKLKMKVKPLDLSGLRIIKDRPEIDNIKRACFAADEVLAKVIKIISKDTTEKQLVFQIEYLLRQQGYDISFAPIVAFGENSAIPHHSSTNREIKKGDFILIDMGAKVNNYCSDITRTFIFGKANEEQRKMYEAVREAQNKSFLYLNGGAKPMKASDVDKTARDFIISQGYPSIPHSVGHGVGIEIHEHPRISPKSKDVIQKKMVFTIEPGIYIPEIGGIRIEDTILFDGRKAYPLTKYPKELIEILG